MNFDFTEKGKSLLREVEKLCSSGATYNGLPSEGYREDGNLSKNSLLDWAEKLAILGYLDAGLDGEANLLDLQAAQQALAAFYPSLFFSLELGTSVFGRLVKVFGSPETHSEILQPLAKGQFIGSVNVIENLNSKDENQLSIHGAEREDGFYITGKAEGMVNAAIADWLAIAGKTKKGFAFFLVKASSEGCSIGKNRKGLGYETVLISDVDFKNCPVSQKHVLGPFENDSQIKRFRMWKDQVITSAAVGLMKNSLNEALTYAKRHKRGGKLIIEYQEVAFMLAEMWTLLDTAQLLVQRSLWLLETGEKEASTVLSCAKVFCCGSAEEVASKAIEILGASGCFRENPTEQSYRNAKILQIAGTSTEISRLKIGQDLLYYS